VCDAREVTRGIGYAVCHQAAGTDRLPVQGLDRP
jgi:hypothetical protein